MPKQLILAEKPSQAQDIAKGLNDNFSRNDGYLEGSRYVISWGYGHLIELEEPDAYDERYSKWSLEDLPIIPERFKYRVSKDGAKQFKIIKSIVGRQDIESIVIATDPGREGELIARLILMMSGNKKPIYRFWTSKALTPEAVREAFGNLKPGVEFDRLYHAAVARQQADWLIGMNVSRAFSVKHNARPPLSLGRVQTPTLRLIVDRELEIRNFKPQDYWLLRALFKHERGEYEALWFGGTENEAGGKASDVFTPSGDNERTTGGDIEESTEKDASSRIPSEAFAKQIMGRIHGKDGIIESCTHNVKKEAPPLLFSLTVLQQEANKLFGYSADRTLDIAQALYEKKLITYPRSDSQHLNDEMAKDVPEILQKLTGYRNVPFDISKCMVSCNNKRVFDSSKLTDHHALIPTGKLPEGLNQDEQDIYDLVVRRFIAAFYPNFEFKTTVVITTVGQDRFKSSGKVVISLGWKDIYGSKDKDQLLPEMKKNDLVKTLKADIEKKQTTPPPRFTDASILEAMSKAAKYVTDPQLKKILKETAGIGTPASIPHHCPVVVRASNNIKILPIGEFIDSFIKTDEGCKEIDGYYTLTFTTDGRVRWSPINHIHKHLYSGPIYAITLENGAMVEVTKYHNIFVLQDGEIKLIQSNEIKKGDYVIVPEKYTLPEVVNEQIDEDIAFLVGLFISEGSFSYGEPIKRIKLSQTSLNKICAKAEELKWVAKGKDFKCFYNLRKANGILGKNLLKLLDVLGIKPEEIPETSLIGKRTESRLCLNFGERHYRHGVGDHVKEICRRKGFGFAEVRSKASNAIKVEVKSKDLIKTFVSIGLTNGAFNKRIPVCFFTATDSVKTALLKGLFCGDSNSRIRKEKKRTGVEINYYSANRRLITDIYFLLNSFGVIPSITERYSITRGKRFKGYILSINSSLYFRKIIDALPDHLAVEKEFIKESETHDKKGIPLIQSGLINLEKVRIRETSSLSMRYKRLSKKILIDLLQIIEKKKGIDAARKVGIPEKLLDFYLNGDILLLKVKDIKIVRHTEEPVYDFSILGYERFVAGDMIFVHNTRASIIETLKKREYITRKGKNIIPTEKGINLIGAVRSEPLSDVAYTAIWEQALDDIASGKVRSSDDFMSGIKKYTAQIVEKVKGSNTVISGATGVGTAAGDGNGLGKCPECGKPVVESQRAFGCSGYKEGCKFTIWKNSLERFGRKTIPASMVKNLLTGKEVKITGLKSKAGKEYEVPGKLVKDEKWGWKINLMFGGK
ncbi:hypothetical protein A45J_2715 [hot springs metagenome]|uniref:DNA topoisomerase n=1 Tax=hot springs metagenome TaxID=433727 RepID=A0A5J4LA43_9ZZZZ